MVDNNGYSYEDHTRTVEAWAQAATLGLSLPQLVDLFEFAMSKLWRRSCLTIGDVTMAAVVDRALFNSVDRHSLLLPLKVDSTGLQWAEFRKSSGQLNKSEVIRAFTFFITEFIAITSNVTGEILSEPLHQELLALKKKEIREVL